MFGDICSSRNKTVGRNQEGDAYHGELSSWTGSVERASMHSGFFG